MMIFYEGFSTLILSGDDMFYPWVVCILPKKTNFVSAKKMKSQKDRFYNDISFGKYLLF